MCTYYLTTYLFCDCSYVIWFEPATSSYVSDSKLIGFSGKFPNIHTGQCSGLHGCRKCVCKFPHFHWKTCLSWLCFYDEYLGRIIIKMKKKWPLLIACKSKSFLPQSASHNIFDQILRKYWLPQHPLNLP